MRSLRCVVLCATVIVLARVPAARAQAGSQPGGSTPLPSAGGQPSEDVENNRSTTRKWAIEVHAGVGGAMGAPGGSGSLPSTGTLASGLLSASTFAFGTGANLLNANLTSAGAASAVITPLDSVLLGSAVTREPQALVGLRLQRALTRRLSLSIAGDYMRGTLSFEPSALTALEATRTSYITALSRALSSPTLASSVTAVTTVTDHQASQMVRGTGSLVYDLMVGRRLDTVRHRWWWCRDRVGEDADGHPRRQFHPGQRHEHLLDRHRHAHLPHSTDYARSAWAARASPTTCRSVLASRAGRTAASPASQSNLVDYSGHPFARKHGGRRSCRSRLATRSSTRPVRSTRCRCQALKHAVVLVSSVAAS
ncbi:MAG: hypothetical protein U0Q11_26705 [Vicinamibacterales bacterium]